MLETSRREFTSREAWRSALAEFIATLLFVFLGAGSVIVSGGLPNGDLDAARLGIIALAHGLAIALLAYATANISGGHINPAGRRFPVRMVLPAHSCLNNKRPTTARYLDRGLLYPLP